MAEILSQDEIDKLMQNILDNGINATVEESTGDPFLCVYCLKKMNIITDSEIRSIKLTNRKRKCSHYLISFKWIKDQILKRYDKEI